MNSITLETESQQIVNQNLMSVLATPILRYPSCDQRSVRDCILRSQVRNLLNILKQRLPFDTNRCVIVNWQLAKKFLKILTKVFVLIFIFYVFLYKYRLWANMSSVYFIRLWLWVKQTVTANRCFPHHAHVLDSGASVSSWVEGEERSDHHCEIRFCKLWWV